MAYSLVTLNDFDPLVSTPYCWTIQLIFGCIQSVAAMTELTIIIPMFSTWRIFIKNKCAKDKSSDETILKYRQGNEERLIEKLRIS